MLEGIITNTTTGEIYQAAFNTIDITVKIHWTDIMIGIFMSIFLFTILCLVLRSDENDHRTNP